MPCRARIVVLHVANQHVWPMRHCNLTLATASRLLLLSMR